MNQVERMSAPAETARCKDVVIEHVCIRALGPDDAGRLSAFFRSLTDEARYRRFMSPVREVSDGLVLQLANVDQRAHVAVAATIENEDGEEVIVGEARYAPCDTDSDASEFALAVRDDWQGRGLGRRMLSLLEQRASTGGLKKLIGETLPHNNNMINLARSLGYRVARHAQDFKLKALEKDLTARPQADQLCLC